MRWRTPTQILMWKQSKEWHRWFAWHPVTVKVTIAGHECIAWLEWVDRRNTSSYWGWVHGNYCWHYKFPEDKE